MPSVKLFVALTDRAHLPDAKIPDLVAYEDFIGAMDGDFAWAEFDENTACGLCYTSGTTGNPKGVLYSHRSNVLHAFVAGQTDALGVKGADSILPVVPMFHANAWALAFLAPMIGAKLVMPGAEARRALDLRAARHGEGDDDGGGADGVAGAAAISRTDRQDAAASEPRRDRRFGRAARDDRDLRDRNTTSKSCMPGA